MRRALYCAVLWLHPPGFRRQFGAEIMWIFDEERGRARFFGDLLLSLFRQWVVRSGVWKIPVVLAGASMPLVMGVGLLRWQPGLHLRVTSPQMVLLVAALAALLAIALTLTLCVAWFRYWHRLRSVSYNRLLDSNQRHESRDSAPRT